MKNSSKSDSVYHFPSDNDDDEEENEDTGREKKKQNNEKKKRRTTGTAKSKRREQNGKGATKGSQSKDTRPMNRYITVQNSMEEHLKEMISVMSQQHNNEISKVTQNLLISTSAAEKELHNDANLFTKRQRQEIQIYGGCIFNKRRNSLSSLHKRNFDVKAFHTVEAAKEKEPPPCVERMSGITKRFSEAKQEELGINQSEVDRMSKVEREQLVRVFKESKAVTQGGNEHQSENLPISSTSAAGIYASSTCTSTTSDITMERDTEQGASVSSTSDLNTARDIELATTEDDEDDTSEASEHATNTLQNASTRTSCITMQNIEIEYGDIKGDNRLMSKRIRKLTQYWNRCIAQGRETKRKKCTLNNDSDISTSHKQSHLDQSEADTSSNSSSSVCINGKSLKTAIKRRSKPIWTFSAWGPPYGPNGLLKKPLPAFGGITLETLQALSCKQFSPPPIPVFSETNPEESLKGWTVREIKPMIEEDLASNRSLLADSKMISNQGGGDKENEVDFFNNPDVNGVIRKGPKRMVRVEGRKRIQTPVEHSDSEEDFRIADKDSNNWMNKGEGMKLCNTYRGKRNKKKVEEPEQSDSLPDLVVVECDLNVDGATVSDGEETLESAKSSALAGRPQRQCRQKRAAYQESDDGESDTGATKKRSRKKFDQERKSETVTHNDIASHFFRHTGAESVITDDNGGLFKSEVLTGGNVYKTECGDKDTRHYGSGHDAGEICDKSEFDINYESLPPEFVRNYNTRGIAHENEAKPIRHALRVSLPIPVINLCKDEIDQLSPGASFESESHIQSFNCGQSSSKIGIGSSGFSSYPRGGISMRLSELAALPQSTRQASQAMPVQRSNSNNSIDSSDSDVICSSNPRDSSEAKFYTSGNSKLNMKMSEEIQPVDNSQNSSNFPQLLSRPPLRSDSILEKIMSESNPRNGEEIAKGAGRNYKFRKVVETNKHKTDNEGGTQQCPVCGQVFDVSIIQQHVNSCLDKSNDKD